MEEFLFGLVVVVLVILFLLGPLVLSALAFRRAGRVRELTERIERLEELLSQQITASAAAGKPPAEWFLPPSTVPSDLAEAQPEPEIPRTPVPLPKPWQMRPVVTSLRAIDWESFIGRKALGWVAVVLIIFAGGFFLKYAFENRWIGPLGRVALAAVAGVGLIIGGRQSRRRGLPIAFQMLTAAGLVLLYAAVYAAFGFYHLLPRGTAPAFLLLIVAEGAVVALLADAPALGLMTILGGLLTPLLLHSETDQFVSLFLYLTALNIGAVLMLTLRHWPGIGTVALLGTHALFWSWYFEQYHPEKRAWALGFHIAVYVLYLGHGLLAQALRRREAGWEDLGRWLLNASLGFAAFYVLLKPDAEPWLGTLAVGLAALYAAMARWMLRARPDENRLFLTTIAIALGLVGAAFPIQAKAAWIALGWAAEGAAMWWFGVRVRSPVLRSLAVVLLVLAVGRLIFVDTTWETRAPYWPVFNDHALPALGVVACWLSALAAMRRRLPGLAPVEQKLAAVAEIGGVLLLWVILSVDLDGALKARAALGGAEASHWERLRQMSLSVLWAVFATVVLVVGFAVHRPRLRWTALAILGLVVLKVFFVDMQGLSEFYRIVAFLVAAIVMGLAAGVYQRLRPEPTGVSLREGQTDGAS